MTKKKEATREVATEARELNDGARPASQGLRDRALRGKQPEDDEDDPQKAEE